MVTLLRCLIIFALGWTAFAQAALVATINKTQSRLGEPLTLRITSPTDLSALDLTPLNRHFELASQTMNRGSRQGRDEYVLDVTLYPLRSGELDIPALALEKARSRALRVRVVPADVSIRAWFPPVIPIAREATVLHLEIRDDGSVSWASPIEIDAPYAVVRALPETTRDETHNGVPQKMHHHRWQILPLKEGSLTVHFGMLDAYRSAQRLRFPVENVSLGVRPAPAYLPLNLPIGRPMLRADPRPQRLIANRLQTWNLYVHAPGLSPEGLRSLLQYSVPDGMTFYLPSITPVMLGDQEYLRVALSYTAIRTARVFPEIRLPYFDVHNQRVETITLPASPVQIRDLARERLLAWGGGIVVLCGVALASWVLWQHWRRRHTKHQWLDRIRATQTPVEMYRQLTTHSPWGVRTPRDLPAALNLSSTHYATLDAMRFGGRDARHFSELKASVAEQISQTATKIYPQSFLHH